MVVLLFVNHEKRKESGSTAFIEFQFCKLKENTRIKKITSVRSINNWDVDSLYLYIDNFDNFFNEYDNLFEKITSNNLEPERIDMFGINYFPKESILEIIKKIEQAAPKDYNILLEWLNHALDYNGFYILGI